MKVSAKQVAIFFCSFAAMVVFLQPTPTNTRLLIGGVVIACLARAYERSIS